MELEDYQRALAKGLFHRTFTTLDLTHRLDEFNL